MSFCPKCGSKVPPDAIYCTNCKALLKEPVESKAPWKLPPDAIERVRMNMRDREETDAVMSFATWFLIGIITAGIAWLYVEYKLIKRRNEHFKRQWKLMESLESILKSIGDSKRADISAALAAMSSARKDSVDNEEEKSAGVWVILSIITGSIAGLYVMYFLTVDIYKHFKNQSRFVNALVSGMNSLGVTNVASIPITVESQYEVPSRSFALYLVLTIITLGIFGIYWSYIIFKDYNEHFRTQWRLEDELVQNLGIAIL